MCNQTIEGKCPSFAILQMIKDPTHKTKTASVNTQIQLNKVINISFDICEKRIYKILKKKSTNCSTIFDKIENELGKFNEIDLQNRFILVSSLASAVCRSCLHKSNGFDEPKFMNLSDLISLSTDSNKDHELDALLAIKSLQEKMRFQPGKRFFF